MRILIIAAAALFFPLQLQAQDTKGYVSGAMMLSWQSTSGLKGHSPSIDRDGVGGTALGITGTVGAFLSPRVSLSAELNFPARLDSRQTVDYFSVQRITSRHRDLMLSAYLHLHGGDQRRLQPDLLVGFGFVHEDTVQTTASRPGLGVPGVFGPESDPLSIVRSTFALSGGFGLAYRCTDLVDLDFQGRLHWVDREHLNGSPTASSLLNLSPIVVRGAVGVRVRF